MKTKQPKSTSPKHHPPRLVRPVAHVLALAPLDVWVRLLRRNGGVSPRYWARMGGIFITSFVGTISTVHERLILRVLRKRLFGRDPQINHEPGTVVILGYYRSGTTHLHNLMSCDRRFVTPRWSQCLAGQGFVFGWSVLRFVLVPFLNPTRPQDSVGFGPDWPAEDDFALCTWGMCSSIPGRFMWPSQWEDSKRWHTLEGLSDDELHRWRSLTAMFVWKLTRPKRNRARIVLLKTPSHTARVQELNQLFGGRVKFVHLVRDPDAVIESNVRLHDALAPHLLEDAPDIQTVRDRIVEEYALTEAKCRDESETLESDRFVRVRYQDLRADGLTTLRTIYDTLGLDWTKQTEASTRRYLAQLGAYNSTKDPIELGNDSPNEQAIKAEMIEQYNLDAPTIERASIEHIEPTPPRVGSAIIAAIGATLACIAIWLGLVWAIGEIWPSVYPRLIPAVWISGAAIGLVTRKAAGNGSTKLGIIAALLTIFVVLSVAFPVAIINHNFASEYSTKVWIHHNTKYGIEGLKSVASIVFIALGAITAYRHASNTGPAAPGTGCEERIP